MSEPSSSSVDDNSPPPPEERETVPPVENTPRATRKSRDELISAVSSQPTPRGPSRRVSRAVSQNPNDVDSAGVSGGKKTTRIVGLPDTGPYPRPKIIPAPPPFASLSQTDPQTRELWDRVDATAQLLDLDTSASPDPTPAPHDPITNPPTGSTTQETSKPSTTEDLYAADTDDDCEMAEGTTTIEDFDAFLGRVDAGEAEPDIFARIRAKSLPPAVSGADTEAGVNPIIPPRINTGEGINTNDPLSILLKGIAESQNASAINGICNLNRSRYLLAQSFITFNVIEDLARNVSKLNTRLAHISRNVDSIQHDVERLKSGASLQDGSESGMTHAGLTNNHGHRDQLSTIARSIADVQQAVSRLAPNAPTYPTVPPRTNPLTPGPATILQRPVPPTTTPHPPTPAQSDFPPLPASQPDEYPESLFLQNPDEGLKWFTNQINILPEWQIDSWCRVITAGGWGKLSGKGKNGPRSWDKDWNLTKKRQYLTDAAVRAFTPGGARVFPLPPNHPFTAAKDVTEKYSWTLYSGVGNVPPQPLPPKGTKARIKYPVALVPRDARTPKTQGPAHTHHTTSTPANPNNVHFSQDQEVYFEDTHPDFLNEVARINNPPPKSYAASASTKANAPAPMRKLSRMGPDVEKWILRAPPEDRGPLRSTDPKVICDRINTKCSTVYGIKALYVQLTAAKNLVIAFDYGSKVGNITAAAKTIIDTVLPGCPKASFSKNLAWSRVAISGVPCQKPEVTDNDIDLVNGNIRTSAELEEELRSSHPLLTNAVFTMAPSWAAKPEVVKSSDLAMVSFAVEDPDGAIIESLTRARIPLFGTLTLPRAWKEKVNMKQCQKCWGFVIGSPHTNCNNTCHICSSRDHSSDMHSGATCKTCINTGNSLDTLEAPTWQCFHFRCRNCGGPHTADDVSCPARNATIASARAKMRGGLTGQTILDRTALRSRPPGSSL